MNEKMFECFGLNYLSKREDLDKSKIEDVEIFLMSDLSILSEREIISTIVNKESFSKKSGELIKVWAAILKSKKLFEIVEGSTFTDVEFVAKLEKFSCSSRFMQIIASIDWKYVVIEANGVCGFYEEIVIAMAKNKSLTVELIEEFDLRGVSWNYRNRFGESVLRYLCKSKPSIDLLTCLLEKEIDINMTNGYGESVFMNLCSSPDVTLNMVKLFFDKGVDVNIRYRSGRTAFMYLCINESITVDMVRLFLDKEVDINVTTDYGETVFMNLCCNPAITLDMMKLFFDRDVDIDLQDANGETAFIGLCENSACSEDMIKLFLEKDIDLNIKNIDGLSPLDCYIRSGGENEGILKLLGQG